MSLAYSAVLLTLSISNRRLAIFSISVSIEKITADPTAAMEGAKKVTEIEHEIDEDYLKTKTLFVKYAEQMNCGSVVIFDDLIEFIEQAADMCADTADYIVILAGGG